MWKLRAYSTYNFNICINYLNKKVGHTFMLNHNNVNWIYWPIFLYENMIESIILDLTSRNPERIDAYTKQRFDYPLYYNKHIFQNWLWLNEFEFYILIMHIRYWRYLNVIDNPLKDIPKINSPRDYHVKSFHRK